MSQPRFYFINKFEQREYINFQTSKTISAKTDPKYDDMYEKCSYFEPIFQIYKILDMNVSSKFKINSEGHIYNSCGFTFQQWIKFIKEYMIWCIKK